MVLSYFNHLPVENLAETIHQHFVGFIGSNTPGELMNSGIYVHAFRWCRLRPVNAAGTDFELDMKYEMIKPIGHGAYGVVISALDHDTNTKVG